MANGIHIAAVHHALLNHGKRCSHSSCTSCITGSWKVVFTWQLFIMHYQIMTNGVHMAAVHHTLLNHGKWCSHDSCTSCITESWQMVFTWQLYIMRSMVHTALNCHLFRVYMIQACHHFYTSAVNIFLGGTVKN